MSSDPSDDEVVRPIVFRDLEPDTRVRTMPVISFIFAGMSSTRPKVEPAPPPLLFGRPRTPKVEKGRVEGKVGSALPAVPLTNCEMGGVESDTLSGRTLSGQPSRPLGREGPDVPSLPGHRPLSVLPINWSMLEGRAILERRSLEICLCGLGVAAGRLLDAVIPASPSGGLDADDLGDVLDLPAFAAMVACVPVFRVWLVLVRLEVRRTELDRLEAGLSLILLEGLCSEGGLGGDVG